MKKLLLAFFLLLGIASTVQAAAPFRYHRANHFAALAPKEGRIVFIGNSITNMHEWRDGLSNPAITNRGISGAISDEVIENLESYIANKPAKVFLMIGTNDLNTNGQRYPEYPFRNIKKIVDRIKNESPTTKIYVQSVLPTLNSRSKENVTGVNKLAKAFCDANGIEFIDLYNLMARPDGGLQSGLSYDDLHLTAPGYAIWCKAIQDRVGSSSAYPDPTQAPNNGVWGAHGMRLTTFAQTPVAATDIIMFGNDMQHGCEWHEVLGNPHVKNRGTGWGNGSADAALMRKFVPGVFKGRADNQVPAKVFVYVGDAEMNNANRDINAAIADYEALIQDIKQAAPGAAIYIESLIPHSNASVNTNRYMPFNAKLKEVAQRQGATFVDLFTPMANGNARNATFFFQNHEHLSGVGYAKAAEILAPLVGNCTPLTVSEAQHNLAVNNARNELGRLLSKVYDMNFDGTLGAYAPAAKPTIDAAVAAAYAELAKGTSAQVADIQAQITAVNAAINQVLPTLVTPGDADTEKWWTIKSFRGGKIMQSNGAGKGINGEGVNTSAAAQWKLVKRADGTFNIQNRADNSFVDPNAAYNQQVKTSATEPEKGWTFAYCHNPGYFNIAAGNVQLNQTNLANAPLYNWSAGRDGKDKDDQGCQFTFETAPTPMLDINTAWYQIKIKNHPALKPYAENAYKDAYVYNATKEYNQNNKNWYPLLVSKPGVHVASDDATYYVHLTKSGSTYLVRSANGHGLAANATATADPQAVAILQDSVGVRLASTWIPFVIGADVILGMTSNTTYTSTRYDLQPINLAAQNLKAWTVVLNGAPQAANISAGTQVLCSRADVKGLKAVYDKGTFFFPANVVPAKSDFALSDNADLSVSIDEKAQSITISYGVKDSTREIETAWYQIKIKNHPALDPYTENAYKDAYVYNATKEYNQNNKNWYPLLVSKPGVNVASDDATYYVHLTKSGSTYLVRSANGHGLAANATATADPQAIALLQDANGVRLASTWIPFVMGSDAILGMTSNATYTSTRYDLQAIDLAAQNLKAWTVLLNGAPEAANISAGTQVLCSRADVKGLKAVYNKGTFFFPANIVPAKDDFSLSNEPNLKVEIDDANQIITVSYGTTGIGRAEKMLQTKLTYFDLQGRRIAKPSQGVCITNGKKVFVH